MISFLPKTSTLYSKIVPQVVTITCALLTAFVFEKDFSQSSSSLIPPLSIFSPKLEPTRTPAPPPSLTTPFVPPPPPSWIPWIVFIILIALSFGTCLSVFLKRCASSSSSLSKVVPSLSESSDVPEPRDVVPPSTPPPTPPSTPPSDPNASPSNNSSPPESNDDDGNPDPQMPSEDPPPPPPPNDEIAPPEQPPKRRWWWKFLKWLFLIVYNLLGGVLFLVMWYLPKALFETHGQVLYDYVLTTKGSFDFLVRNSYILLAYPLNEVVGWITWITLGIYRGVRSLCHFLVWVLYTPVRVYKQFKTISLRQKILQAAFFAAVVYRITVNRMVIYRVLRIIAIIIHSTLFYGIPPVIYDASTYWYHYYYVSLWEPFSASTNISKCHIIVTVLLWRLIRYLTRAPSTSELAARIRTLEEKLSQASQDDIGIQRETRELPDTPRMATTNT